MTNDYYFKEYEKARRVLLALENTFTRKYGSNDLLYGINRRPSLHRVRDKANERKNCRYQLDKAARAA